MMTVYIVGPMSGYPDNNRLLFMLAEKWVRSSLPGDTGVFNPATYDQSWSYKQLCDYGLRQLEVSDTLLLLPGWQKSRGSIEEIKHSLKGGKLYRYLELHANLLITSIIPHEMQGIIDRLSERVKPESRFKAVASESGLVIQDSEGVTGRESRMFIDEHLAEFVAPALNCYNDEDRIKYHCRLSMD